jgi:hypothetical protein
MTEHNIKIKDNDGKEFILVEKYDDHDKVTYYEVFEYSYYETYGSYIGDFVTSTDSHSAEFCNEFTEWIKNEL